MVLAYHGRDVSPEEIRRATRTSRDGVDAVSIIQAARSYGLDARGVQLDLDSLGYLERGSILHWEFNHFVVFDRVVRGAVEVLDPALGRVRVPMERFSKSFTGVAIVLRPTETFEPSGAGSRGTWRYLRAILRQSGLLSRIGVVSLFIQVFALATPILTGVIVDWVVPAGDRGLLTVVTLGLLAMVAFHFLTSFLRAHLLLVLRANLDMSIAVGFIDHLVRLPYAFFLQRSAGDLLMRLTSNSTVRETLTTGALSTLLDGSLVGLYLLLIFAQSFSMGLVVLSLATIQILILVVTHRRMQRLMSETLQAQARAQSYLVQLLNGIETLKAAGAESRGVSQWTNLFVDEVNASLARGRLNAVVEASTGALRVGSPLIVLAVGAVGVLNGDLSLGTMLALSALATGFLMPLSNLIATGLQLQLLRSFMERINDVLDTPREQDLDRVRPADRFTGKIVLEDVSFSYSEDGPPAVNDVSLDIEPGQTIALVGRSGSGKSTLAHLILGLYRPSKGRVLYDEIDLEELEAGSVRSQLGIVPQNSFLFGSTIRANVSMTKPDATNEEIERAVRLACIADDIAAMPLGYDTVLSDGGASLSGGQRQRIALARALVHDPAILVLDEATSSLDSVTESRIYENLEQLSCTRIVIAHRISTIARADMIYVMDDGRFVERGRHEELLARRGPYHALAGSQGQTVVAQTDGIEAGL